jgi:hypothetical protein
MTRRFILKNVKVLGAEDFCPATGREAATLGELDEMMHELEGIGAGPKRRRISASRRKRRRGSDRVFSDLHNAVMGRV